METAHFTPQRYSEVAARFRIGAEAYRARDSALEKPKTPSPFDVYFDKLDRFHEESIIQPQIIDIIANRGAEKGKAGGLSSAIHAFAHRVNHIEITWTGWDGKVTSLRRQRKQRVAAEIAAQIPTSTEMPPLHTEMQDETVEQEGFQEAASTLHQENYQIKATDIPFTKKEKKAHYINISNNWYWLINHGEQALIHGEFNTKAWNIHKRVLEKFADTKIDDIALQPDKPRLIWTHDYHLALLGKMLRDKGVDAPLAYFAHTSIATPEELSVLPETPRREMLEGLLGNDLLGFQTTKDAKNLMACAKEYLDILPEDIHETETGGYIHYEGRIIKLDTYPISIDPVGVKETVEREDTQRKIEKLRRIFKDKILFVDGSRLDPQKGILEELDAYDKFLEDHPELRDKAVFLRAVAPSREDVPAYAQLKLQIKEKVDTINEKYKKHGKKIMHLDKGVKPETLLALLAVSKIAFITPKRDGLNLVIKEAAIAGPDNMVIIVGEGAGASVEFKDHAIIVNVRDVEQTAEALYQAVTMDESEKIARKKAMEQQVRENDVEKWSMRFIHDAVVHSSLLAQAA